MSFGHVAVVTGAASGIGRAIALRLAADGFDVAINDRDNQVHRLESLAEEISAKGRKALIAITDVSCDDQVKAMVEKVVKEMGRLDVVSLTHPDAQQPRY
jgi:meso-butanediol dehydrogenase / (S,S)-butanediol dehydrogenase / diacetyl reductase